MTNLYRGIPNREALRERIIELLGEGIKTPKILYTLKQEGFKGSGGKTFEIGTLRRFMFREKLSYKKYYGKSNYTGTGKTQTTGRVFPQTRGTGSVFDLVHEIDQVLPDTPQANSKYRSFVRRLLFETNVN